MMTALCLGAIAGLFAATLLRARGRRYRGAFQLPARRDDLVVCRGDHQTVAVSLGSDGFDAPAGLVSGGQTAFMTLNVAATTRGGLVDPFIEVEHGPRRYRQYFERGATGKRTLNLSPLLQETDRRPLARIRMRGNAIRWGDVGSLKTFDAPSLPPGDVLVLAPHPDDAEIATFGMYASRPSWVATMTAGDRGSLDLSVVVPEVPERTAWKADLRIWDSLTIPALGGVPREHCLNLVYPDGRLAEMFREPSRTFRLACEEQLARPKLRSRNLLPEFQGDDSECSWNGLVDDLRALMAKSGASVVLCPHPLIDVHPDHVFTTVALDRALREHTGVPPLLLLYVVDVRDARLHPFGPAEAVASLPPLTGTEWIADSIYSHALTPHQRQGKFFAVEAAHDLRTYGTGGPKTAEEIVRSTRRVASAFVSGMGLDPMAYTRRAPRPNEIYYVVSRASLGALVERAVARFKPAGSP